MCIRYSYQNSDHNMYNAEKELMFSLSKSYDLYNYMLQLIVAITQDCLLYTSLSKALSNIG